MARISTSIKVLTLCDIMRNVASCHDLTVLDVLDVVHGSRSVKNNPANYFRNTSQSVHAKIKPRNKRIFDKWYVSPDPVTC